MNVQIAHKLDYQNALRYGFPTAPHHGETVLDTKGRVWVWIDAPQAGMGDLGFWGALISAVAGPLLSLFSGGGDKQKQELMQGIQQQQQQIDQLSQAVAAEQASGKIDKKTLFLMALALLAFMYAK